MRVSVLVCTYGRREWALRGAQAARDVGDAAHEVIALHEPGATLAEVRNLAATAVTGDWLCFLDADDSLDDGYIAAMRATHEDATADLLLVPAVSFVSEGGCSEPTIPAWDRLIYDVNCAVVGTLIPSRLFAEVGGFHEWSAYEDWELWLRCIAAGARMQPVPGAVYCARAEDGTGRNTLTGHSVAYARIRTLHADVPRRVWADAKRP